jgi:alginate O-acetyltransferase complex protein AlgI
MVFSSHLFLFYFLPLVLGLYALARRTWRLVVLAGCSLAFYVWANPWFVLVLLTCAVIDFVCANGIDGHWSRSVTTSPPIDGERVRPPLRWRRFLVGCSLSANLGMLLFFKYAMFVDGNLHAWFGPEAGFLASGLVVLLPIGISFYTFESISYILDIHAGRARPASVWIVAQATREGHAPRTWWDYVRLELRGFLTYLCYLTQFPHLVAGPIIRYPELEIQLHERQHTVEKFARGVAFFSLGLAKKILLANPMGQIADATFAADGLAWFDAWYGAVAYSFQLYFDFSGYSDMAIGLALLFGFNFPRNFHAPYRAESITDFWRRWHISLSTWLRDYLYIPLGGNRHGALRAYRNLLIVMLVGGFWHGAEWTFMVWGLLHGLMLCGERLLGKQSSYQRLPRFARIALTFAVVTVAWVFFRSPTIAHAGTYCLAMIGLEPVRAEADLLQVLLYDPYHVLCFALCATVVWGGTSTWEFTQRLSPAKALLCLALLLLAIASMWGQSANPFLYFRF